MFHASVCWLFFYVSFLTADFYHKMARLVHKNVLKFEHIFHIKCFWPLFELISKWTGNLKKNVLCPTKGHKNTRVCNSLLWPFFPSKNDLYFPLSFFFQFYVFKVLFLKLISKVFYISVIFTFRKNLSFNREKRMASQCRA